MSKRRIAPFLLVLTLVLCPAAEGRHPLDVNNTLDVYQAEEHSNVTLMLLSPVNTASDSLHIYVINEEQQRCIYRYDSKVQADPYTDDVFRDRLQCEPQLVGNREIHCFLTDLRLSDSGIYQGIVEADGKRKQKICELIVKAVLQKTQEKPPTVPRERFGIIVAFSLFAFVLFVLSCCAAVQFCNSRI